MQIKKRLANVIFCLVAAITAAAAIDPAMEGLANAGLFGPGNFTDHSNLDVLPALGIGLALSILFVAAVARRALCRRGYAPDWLRRCARASDVRAVPRLLPVIFALQLLMLWSMETLEQVVVAGHPLGGTVWLGGPALVSLMLHAFGCLAITWLLARALRWSAQTIVEVVTFLRHLFCRFDKERAARRARSLEIPSSRFLEPILARLSGRAPPYLTA